MNKMHTLAGEEFFRDMMRLEDERKRLLAGSKWSVASSVRSSNVVSLEDYRRRHSPRETDHSNQA
jgi:hypothetical protein